MVGLFDSRAYGQSDVMHAERRGVFSDLWLSRFLQSGEEEGQGGWCLVSSSTSLSLTFSQLEFWSTNCRPSSFDLSLLRRILSFISFFSSDQIKLGFLCFLPHWPKNYFYLFSFFDKFHRHFSMRWSYAQKPLFSILKKVSALITSHECSHGH